MNNITDSEVENVDYFNLSRHATGIGAELDFNKPFNTIQTLFGEFRNLRVALEYISLVGFPDNLVSSKKLKRHEIIKVNSLKNSGTENKWAIMTHIIWERLKSDPKLISEMCLLKKDITFTSFNIKSYPYDDKIITKRLYLNSNEKYVSIVKDIFDILKEYLYDNDSIDINSALLKRNMDEIESKVRLLISKYKTTNNSIVKGLPFDIDINEIDYKVGDKHILAI